MSFVFHYATNSVLYVTSCSVLVSEYRISRVNAGTKRFCRHNPTKIRYKINVLKSSGQTGDCATIVLTVVFSPTLFYQRFSRILYCAQNKSTEKRNI